MTPRQFLVVDDDVVFAGVLARAIERRGHRAAVANDADTALELQRSQGPSHVILDLKLGNASGLDVLDGLIERDPGVQVVLLTGYASIATAVDAIKRGAANYVAKPADASTILRAFGDESEAALPPAEPTPLRSVEWEHIQRVLAANDGNVARTARALGLHRRTLQRKLAKRGWAR
jgi:two-component system response regulator RegA